jgi:hypothetical protein
MSVMLAVCLAILAAQASAQASPSTSGDPQELSTLEISLWPEFDRPEVLVIYRGLFTGDTQLPVPVEFRIPARVGKPTAVAYVDEQGQRLNQEFSTRDEGDWLVLSFELPTRGFQLEYYDALPIDSTGQRQYAYAYVADYPTAQLELDFQVPPTAGAFVLDPPADSQIREDDDLLYHIVDAGSLAQSEERGWTFAYEKADSNLTVDAFLSSEPASESPGSVAPATGSQGNSTVVVFLVAFVALVAVGAGAFWLGRRTLPPPSPPPSRRSKRRGSGRGSQGQPGQVASASRPASTRDPSPREAAPSPGEGTLFCYQCGTQLRPDSEFCHRCGAAIRDV